MELFFKVFDLSGTLVFGIAGALVAKKKRLDIYGIFILAIVTALGGGMIRDVLLGRTPPIVFTDISFLLFSGLGAMLVIFFHKTLERFHHALRIMDALGLGIFTVIGVNVTIASGGSWFAAVMLGIITGTGGGMVRDVLAKEVPMVLQREVYAVASMIGAIFYTIWLQLPQVENFQSIQGSLGALLSAALIAAIRIITVYRNWHLPKLQG